MTKLETDLYQSISIFSEQIEKLISEGEWDSLNQLLIQRQKTLENFFSLFEPNIDDISKVTQLIYRIQKEDTYYLKIVNAQKNETEKQCLSLKQGRKSVKAYQI